MAHPFISYKREQRPFAESITTRLTDRGHPVWVDTKGLLPAEPWGPGVRSAIIACQVFIVVLEAEWLRSKPCLDELACAVEHGKKIVVVVSPSLDERTYKASIEHNAALATLLPEAVKSSNFIWSAPTSLDAVVDHLILALQLDFEWNARSSWLQQRAVAWVSSGRRHGLVRGDELLQTLREVDGARGKLPKPTDLALEFLRASQQEQRNEVLLTEAEYEWRQGNFGDALQRNFESWRLTRTNGSQPGPRQILMAHRLLELYGGAHQLHERLSTATLADNGSWIAVGRGDHVLLWKSTTVTGSGAPKSGRTWPTTPDLRFSLTQGAGPIERIAFDRDADTALLAVARDSAISVWSVEGARQMCSLHSELGPLSQLTFSQDRSWLFAVGQEGCAVWDLNRGTQAPLKVFAAGRFLSMCGSWLIEGRKAPHCTISMAGLIPGQEIDFATN